MVDHNQLVQIVAVLVELDAADIDLVVGVEDAHIGQLAALMGDGVEEDALAVLSST